MAVERTKGRRTKGRRTWPKPPGPNCPESGVAERLAAACRFLADCAIAECAYKGAKCRAAVYESCVAIGEPDDSGNIEPAAKVIGNVICAKNQCDAVIVVASSQDDELRKACMEGQPVITCE